ncbi:hypothetical protein Acr_00g0017470 [Actinidia rufa]|uniref:Uncharacterized protein n=1 Tax=Actinidia rufa TaxID=165716 RepID=A0A7J0DBT2_9ERIC|nr:hypothetical protein Acr_00g0017470 [Actinidia rufa]
MTNSRIKTRADATGVTVTAAPVALRLLPSCAMPATFLPFGLPWEWVAACAILPREWVCCLTAVAAIDCSVWLSYWFL